MLVMIKAESMLERCAIDDLKVLVLQWTSPECSNIDARLSVGCVKHGKHMKITNDSTDADQDKKCFQALHCAFCTCVKTAKRLELKFLCVMKILY